MISVTTSQEASNGAKKTLSQRKVVDYRDKTKTNRQTRDGNLDFQKSRIQANAILVHFKSNILYDKA